MSSSLLKLSLWPEEIWMGQSWPLREGSGHTKVDMQLELITQAKVLVLLGAHQDSL